MRAKVASVLAAVAGHFTAIYVCIRDVPDTPEQTVSQSAVVDMVNSVSVDLAIQPELI